MDIFAHGLWAGAAAKAATRKGLRISAWRAALWGVFPDFFAFAPLFVWLIIQLLFTGEVSSLIARPDAAEPPPHDGMLFQITQGLYSISHSFFVFILVCGVLFLLYRLKIFRRIPWEIGGWFLHILIDIPTHSYEFYPTPFLWPLSDWKFDGFSWGHPWFIFINYVTLFAVYLPFLMGRSRSHS